MPLETGNPNSWKVMRTILAVQQFLLPFAELVVDECHKRIHRLTLVFALGLDLDLGADPRGQHHHAHDALGIDAPAVAAEENLAAKASRELGELGRRARVQAELVIDPGCRLDHCHALSESGSGAATWPPAFRPTSLRPPRAPPARRANRRHSRACARASA